MYGHRPKRVNEREGQTVCIEVFLAGDVSTARNALREYCIVDPCCVTLTETDFIYRGGLESGVVVGIREYPRFPAGRKVLADRARSIAEFLRQRLCQDSYMIVEQDKTTWGTTREGGS